MSNHIVELFVEHGCILDPDAAHHVNQQSDPEGYVRRVLGAFLEVPFHLTLAQLLEAEATFLAPPPPPALIPSSFRVLPPSLPPAPDNIRAADYAADVRILQDASRDPAPTGDTEDFLSYFNDRYEALSKLLRRRREVANAVPLNRALHAGREVQLIGMVTEVSKAPKAGHRFVELEDRTGTATVLIHQSRPDLVAFADTLLTDEVIGVAAKTSKDGTLLIADHLLRPDLPLQGERAPLEVPLYAAFLGDIHVGSKTFLAPEFRRLVRWLQGAEGSSRERAIAQQVKYLVLPGDIVDGVGVYPNQEASLLIHETYKQYEALAKELEGLPDHLHLVILPGNHDASRPTEPQPALDKEIQSYFSALETTFVSNPSLVALHGRSVLAYHGFSMIDFATTVPGMSLERPTEIMKQMLQCRHLAPAYGAKTPIAPQKKDHLLIGREPDIFVTGHVHVAALDRYKGVTLINGGTWQAQTDYQRMHNLRPTPGVLPLVNLSTLNTTKIDFSLS